MASALMEAEESSIISENTRITGLESQILNSQEIIVRLNRELDSALLRISTLENVCSENQTNLHEKRLRIQQLDDDVIEREETNERLTQELSEKDERLKTLDDLIIQLKQHIKQAREENENEEEQEQKQADDNNQCQDCQLLLNEFGDTSEDFSLTDLHSQILFDRELRQLILQHFDDNTNSLNNSPQAILDQYDNTQRLKFHNLLQKSLTTEDISTLIDSDDVLFELLTPLNSLIRLKETLSHDSKELQHIRSLLHLTTDDNTDEVIKDLINKRECIEYLRTKIDNNNDLIDFDLIKHVLHDYFNFQQQQIELKEFLHVNDDKDLNYSRLLIERCSEANHVGIELNTRIKSHEQTIEQLGNQLNEYINQTIERRKEIDEIVSKFSDQSIDQDTNEVSQLNRIQSILQSNVDFRHALSSETSVTSNEDILHRVREYKSSEKSFDQDQQQIIDELTKEINELKEETSHRKDQLTELTEFAGLNNDDEETQLDHIRSSLQSSSNFQHALSDKLSVTDNSEAILQRIDDYQLIINAINSPEKEWTSETTDELIAEIEKMKTTENIIEDLQKRFDEVTHNELQLQLDIEQIANEFAPTTTDDDESNITRLRHSLESLTNFHQKLCEKTQMNSEEDILQLFETYQFVPEKKDVDSQTTDIDDFFLQIKELTGIEDDSPEEVLNKINELFSNNEKLRNELNTDDENLVESVMKLNQNFHQLNEEHRRLVEKEDNIDRSIERLMNKLGLSSDSSSRTQIDEISAIFDTFCHEYCQLTSTDIEIMNLTEIFKHIQVFLVENNRLKILINQINFDNSSENFDYISKLQTYLTKVDTLCELIDDDNVNIDQALIMYRKKMEQDQDTIEKISDFKQQLLTRLSIDNEGQILDRLNEITQINTDFKQKLQHNDDVTNTITSLNLTVTEQRHKILEHEETIEKLRTQRERMLSKMKEMKTNNETITTQFQQANSSVNEFHRKEIDYKNQIEAIQQKLRGANNQIQVTLDESRAQQDLQETMKLEIESIKNEMETQRKLYESRCRQIINEKNQLDKNRKELVEQKQLSEDENKRLHTVLQTIKDTLENVDDINSIVDTILKLRQDHMTLTSNLNQRNEQIHFENEKLLLNIHQQQSTINEYIQIKTELEKRLFDNEQQLTNFKQEIKENIDQYQRLQNEYELYKEDKNQMKKNSQVAIINIEQSSPPPQPHLLAVQHAADSNKWMAIDMKDEESPLASATKHSTTDTLTSILNLLGELKSKLGITLTHRPRSSSVFFLYLCAVHLLTIYLLFFRHC